MKQEKGVFLMMGKMLNLTAVIVLLFLIDAAYVFPSENSNNGYFSYSGEQITLDITDTGGMISGWGLKEDSIESLGSTIDISIINEDFWYKNISLSLFSTNSLIPTEYGNQSDSETSIDNMAIAMGLSKGWTPKLKYERLDFSATGVVRSWGDLFKNGERLNTNDEFDLSFTVERFVFVWTWERGNPFEQLVLTPKGSGQRFSLGIAHMEGYVVEEVELSGGGFGGNVEETVEGYGLAISYEYRNIFPLGSDSFRFYFGPEVHMNITDVGSFGGYGVGAGLMLNLSDNVFISPHGGVFFWPYEITGEHDKEYESFGGAGMTKVGLNVEITW